MPLPKETTYTVEDIYNLPEGERAELIDGQIYYMAPTPSLAHQLISGEIATAIYNYIKAHKGKCKVLMAPFAVFLNKDDKNYVKKTNKNLYNFNKSNIDTNYSTKIENENTKEHFSNFLDSPINVGTSSQYYFTHTQSKFN